MQQISRYATIALLLLPLFVLHAADTTFSRTISIGMRGEDVRALQQFLNTDTTTQVAKSGVGSPGNETDYFGPMTQRALIKFQEKYSAEILAPLGLTSGTGVFGKKTRAKTLVMTKTPVVTKPTSTSKTETVKTTTPSLPSIPSSPTTTAATINAPVPWTPDMVVPEGVNPNSINLEYLIADMKKVGTRQGISDTELAIAEKAIRETAATSTDLTKKFFESATIKYARAELFKTEISLPEENIVGKILIALGLAKVAHAAAPLPFGGKVTLAIPCTCSAGTVWLLSITPLPPTYAAILSYVSGTQLFASYVPTPHTAQSFLGFYSAGVQMCLMTATPCAPAPNEGMITPDVGSSL